MPVCLNHSDIHLPPPVCIQENLHNLFVRICKLRNLTLNYNELTYVDKFLCAGPMTQYKISLLHLSKTAKPQVDKHTAQLDHSLTRHENI